LLTFAVRLCLKTPSKQFLAMKDEQAVEVTCWYRMVSVPIEGFLEKVSDVSFGTRQQECGLSYGYEFFGHDASQPTLGSR